MRAEREINFVEITISVTKEVEKALAQKAAAEGQDLKVFIENMVKTQALRPSLEELLAPVRQDFAESRISEDEIDALIESERLAGWKEKRGKRT